MLESLIQQQKNLSKQGPSWLPELRAAGMKRFLDLGLPTKNLETWKYTNVKPLEGLPFELGKKYQPGDPHTDHLQCVRFGKPEGVKINFVNGQFAPSLSGLSDIPEGMVISSIAEALKNNPDDIRPYLNKNLTEEREPFAALNTAFLSDGAFIRIPKGVVLKEPIEISFYTLPNGTFCATLPRVIIVAEPGSEATLIETYAGKLSEKPYLTNSFSEIHLQSGSVLHHYKIQDECENSYHLSSLRVHQADDSTFKSANISIGGRLCRQEVYSRLESTGADCTLNGLYMVHGKQHVDNQTFIDHAEPHCTSRELFKGILDDQSHGVFNGQILVRPGAQKTHSSLTNNNLLLSKEALIDTKPLLEIFNDDVKCSHGATIGRLDENQIFYLRSRGIDWRLARQLLTYAFASEVVQDIQVGRLRAHLEEILLNRLHIGEQSVGGSA